MEIQYLKTLQKYSTIDGLKSVGVLQAEIEQIEIQLDIQFPKAYKEFLFLAGELNNGLFGNAIADDLENAVEYFQEFAQLKLQETGASISKPFWVFTSMDACEQFDFFYLNEGEDPVIYSWFILDAINKYQENGLPIGVKKYKNSFSEYVTFCIDLHKKGEI